MTKDLFDKYIWLVDTIYRAGKITFEEINERWLRSRLSEGEDIPLRTFHNWRIAIEQVFDININCNRKGGVITTILRMRMICKREVSATGCSIHLRSII